MMELKKKEKKMYTCIRAWWIEEVRWCVMKRLQEAMKECGEWRCWDEMKREKYVYKGNNQS